jgi:Tol biopolymer transport system component
VPAESWPFDTPVAVMLERVRARQKEIRNRRRARNTAIGAAVSVVMAVALVAALAADPVTSKVQTVPAAESGAAPDPSRSGGSGTQGAEGRNAGSGEGGGIGLPSGGGVGETGSAGTVPSSPPTVQKPLGTTTTSLPVPAGSGGVAFVRGYRVFRMHPDGSHLGPLTDASHRLDHPDWAPDGSRLVAVEWRTDATGSTVGRLVVIGVDGAVKPLTGEASYESPKWSPDGSRIAFARRTSPLWTAPTYDLWTVNVDGSDERKVADEVGFMFSWSPDGKRLAYQCQGFCTVRADGTDVRRIPNTANYVAPTWSPDGKRLAAFAAGADKSLVTISLDGGDRRVVVAGVTTTQLDWSPDGGTLVFSAGDIDGRPSCKCTRIWRVGADGLGLRALSEGGPDYSPTWSPQPGP